MSLDSLFQNFLREKRYIKNVSEHTISFYQDSYKAWKEVLPGDDLPTKASLNLFVVGLRERGKSPACVDAPPEQFLDILLGVASLYLRIPALVPLFPDDARADENKRQDDHRQSYTQDDFISLRHKKEV